MTLSENEGGGGLKSGEGLGKILKRMKGEEKGQQKIFLYGVRAQLWVG